MNGYFEVMAAGYNTDTKKNEIYHVIDPGPEAITMNVNSKNYTDNESTVSYATYGLTIVKCCEAYQAYHSNKEITIGEDPDLQYPNNGGYDPMSVKRYFPRGFKFYPLLTKARYYNKPLSKPDINISNYMDEYYSRGPNRKQPFYLCAHVEKYNTIFPIDMDVSETMLDWDFELDSSKYIMVFRTDPNKIKKPITNNFKFAIRALTSILKTADYGMGNTRPTPSDWYFDVPSGEEEKFKSLRSSDFKFYLVNDLKNPKWDSKMKVLSESIRAALRENH